MNKNLIVDALCGLGIKRKRARKAVDTALSELGEHANVEDVFVVALDECDMASEKVVSNE